METYGSIIVSLSIGCFPEEVHFLPVALKAAFNNSITDIRDRTDVRDRVIRDPFGMES